LTTIRLRVDLHIHTCVSKDGSLQPAEVIRIAKGRGLDRICITDHNRIEGALAAQKIDPEFVIVGEEILTRHGELLAFFVSEWVPPHLSHQEALARLEAQGAVISVSHPFDPHRNQPWTEPMLEAILPWLNAIEGFNARTLQAGYNERAQAFALAHKLPVTAGSDAHTGSEIGAAYLEIAPFTTAQEFKAGLVDAKIQGRLSPAWVHFLSAFNTLRGRLGLKPTLRQ
jgi:hypothetical protein